MIWHCPVCGKTNERGPGIPPPDCEDCKTYMIWKGGDMLEEDNFKDEFGDTSGSGINGDVLHMEVPFTDILEALNTIILNQRELIDFLRQYTSYPISVKYQKYSGPGPY